ncbi:MAG: hypothetical protein A2271_01380 [Candidatus Moranbacteria bacterium RIFOXYA12_FULL_35_19]|nr:MAG: hypothetical protein UR78_C0025G0014 [Candidatus Moranbacteria bacterium GW2011_GWF2_35_39]OGI32956.1 MAG: hypothetical protein A2489_00900 [Candidatus Moranbacteria bacterium RIFOXYC12_FULL_36_13]OGI35641.1 MAG: hypothetical protein A2271_01380 [Candidatus Moranbacteria bacterium RIFOXYA12_FULL_35_19]
MLLGFSSGCLYKTQKNVSREIFDIIRNTGANAIEVMCRFDDSIEKLLDEFPCDYFSGFNYVSLHAPKMIMRGTKETFSLIEKVQNKFNFNLIVFHPDEITDWDVFKNSKIPIGFENMDNRKKSHKTLADMKKAFEIIPNAKFVLDVNHVFTNDRTMRLAKDFIINFSDRLAEIHLSGFETLHEPLFKTKQKEIIDVIPDKNLPIIIESVCETTEEIKEEFKYIKNHLK